MIGAASSWTMVSSSLALLGIVCGVFWAEHLKAQDAKPTELQVKAAYLSNFGRFVEWHGGGGEDGGALGSYILFGVGDETGRSRRAVWFSCRR